jgi:rod shape-determining protein MreC
VRELLRRFRYPLTYLLLTCLCVIRLAASPRPSELSLPGRLLLDLTVPLERMVTLPLSFVREGLESYVALVGVREENVRLRERVDSLEQENLRIREQIVSTQRFERLRELQERHGLQMVPANVIAQDLSAWLRAIVIDQGSEAGIRSGMAVVGDAGVAGVVTGTTPSAARVMLLIDPQSRVDVHVERTRSRGTVRGRSADTCDFDYVLRDEDLEDGDLLVTSGLDGVYPKGLQVGRVRNVRRKPYGLFLEAEVEPAVDFGRLEEVSVILDHRQTPPHEAFGTEGNVLFPSQPGP